MVGGLSGFLSVFLLLSACTSHLPDLQVSCADVLLLRWLLLLREARVERQYNLISQLHFFLLLLAEVVAEDWLFPLRLVAVEVSVYYRPKFISACCSISQHGQFIYKTATGEDAI